ncbi:peptidase inhibitor family I36 protein [Streptomyces sp. H39-S7]|nr:peptidase inhibitor family I36 protein [Streptomyces sp. H39-S7]
MSASEARGLQTKVDAAAAKWGGTQVAANKIRLSGGELTLTLPGEKYTRDLNATGTSAAVANPPCPYTYVCAYEGRNFTGAYLSLFTCDTLNYIPFTEVGSWKNNQRAALRAKFYSKDKVLRWTSPGGYSEDPAADWSWVWYLSPC